MRIQIILFSALITILFITGCSTTTSVLPTTMPPTATIVPTPAISTEDILGIWTLGGAFVQFSEDGTYRIAWEVESLKNDPFIVGNFQFDENSNVLTFERTMAENCHNIPGDYEIQLTADEVWMRLTLVEDACESRVEYTAKYSPYKRIHE